MCKNEIIISGLPVEIVRKRNLKNLYIRVNPPEGNVTVNCSFEPQDEEIKLYIMKKMPEITKVRDRMLAQNRQSKREYVSGESHYLWGKPYRLQVIYDGKRYKIEKAANKIILTVPEGTNVKTKEKIFVEWYRKELTRVLGTVASDYEKKMNIDANEFRVKNMRTRWGTCNIEKRRIWINLQLVKKPIECLEYVVVHELVHLLEKNHTNKFNTLVEEYYPAWREAKNLLTTMPLDYIEKGVVDTDE